MYINNVFFSQKLHVSRQLKSSLHQVSEENYKAYYIWLQIKYTQ